MKKSKFGLRVLAMVLTMIMVLSLVPMSAWAAIHDITTGSYRGLVGVDTTSIGKNGEINWPVKIYDYQSDGMLFEYASSWLMDTEISDESTVAEKGGILYGGGEPMPVTKLGMDFTGKKAYSTVAYTTPYNNAGANYTKAVRTPPNYDFRYLHLSPNKDTVASGGSASNFYVTDFANDLGGAVAKDKARYMVIAYYGKGLNTSAPFSVCVANSGTPTSANGNFKRGTLNSSYGITNGKWTYVVIDLQTLLGTTNWNGITKMYKVLISVALEKAAGDYIALSHIAYFDNEAEAERYGQKAVAFDNNPGEYLGNLSTNKWNLGNNLAFGLLLGNTGGGNPYWTGGAPSTNPLNPLITAPIVIEDQAWIGAKAFVGMGVTIGQGAVVGATASVYKDVAPWTVVGGNPAKFIKERKINGERMSGKHQRE